MTVDKNYFPGWVRKSITFTIDDGNIRLDKRFIDTVKPYGIKGTFNLPSANTDSYTPEFYREFYRGYGIANHCLNHPFVMSDADYASVTDEPFDSSTADPERVYKTEREGMYLKRTRSGWWSKSATDKVYCELASEAQERLTEVFERRIAGFVWPYGEQNSDYVKEYLKKNFSSVRKTGVVADKTGFAMPADRYAWSYNAAHTCLNEVAKLYDDYEDDGELKFFSFGVHSHDFENGKCWDVLERFVRDYGNRHGEFYYADVDTIFEYEDAIKALDITDDGLINKSEYDLYVKVDGRKIIVPAASEVSLRDIREEV